MLLCGSSPFKGKNYQTILEENRKANINYEKLNSIEISYDCRQNLKKMLD